MVRETGRSVASPATVGKSRGAGHAPQRRSGVADGVKRCRLGRTIDSGKVDRICGTSSAVVVVEEAVGVDGCRIRVDEEKVGLG